MGIEINKLLDIIKKAGYEEIPTNYNRLYFNTIDVSVIVDKALEQQQAEIAILEELFKFADYELKGDGNWEILKKKYKKV